MIDTGAMAPERTVMRLPGRGIYLCSRDIERILSIQLQLFGKEMEMESKVNGQMPEGFTIVQKTFGQNGAMYEDGGAIYVNKRGELYVPHKLWKQVGEPDALLIGVDSQRRTACMIPTGRDTNNAFILSNKGITYGQNHGLRMNAARWAKEMRLIVADHTAKYPVIVRDGKILMDIKATPVIVK